MRKRRETGQRKRYSELCCVLAILFTLILPQSATAQNLRAGNWFFGKYLNLPFSLSGSYIEAGTVDNPMTTLKSEWGCSSISTPSGTLLFYTDGDRVWNASHTVMSGGTGLHGDPGAKRSSVIVPKPSLLPGVEPDEYYIFYTTSDHHLKYAVVSMSTGVGGTVVLKNQDITPAGVTVGQTLTACLHTNGRDAWLVTHSISERRYFFYVYKIDSYSISLPKKYDTHQSAPGVSNLLYVKFSPNGKYIGCTVQGSHEDIHSNKLIVYDFDPLTGIVYRFRQCRIGFVDERIPYVPSALEFSVGSNYVYVAAHNPEVGSGGKMEMFQFPVADIASQTQLPKRSNDPALGTSGRNFHHEVYPGDMQLAPNGDIYFILQNHRGSLSNREEVWSFGGTDEAQDVASGSREYFEDLPGEPEYYSLPNFVTSYLDSRTSYTPPCDECLTSMGGSVLWGTVQSVMVPPPQDYAIASPIQVLYQTRTCNSIEELRIVSVITVGRDFPSTLYPVQRLFWYLEDRGLRSTYLGWINSVAPLGSGNEKTCRFYQIPCWNLTYCSTENRTFWEPASDEFCCYREYIVGTDCNNKLTRVNATSYPSSKGTLVTTICGDNLLPSPVVEACTANGGRTRTHKIDCERTEWKEIP